MDKLVIRGGKPLHGVVAISGAKNAALPALAATLLTADKVYLRNVPHLRDVTTMLELLGQHGASILIDDRMNVEVDSKQVHNLRAPYDLVRTMRASVLVLGPLLARHGRAEISLPGGCAIGERPIDQHLMGFAALGAEISLDGGYVQANSGGLQGATVVFDMVTVTGTENVMMAAVLAHGRTILENAACEPEITDLALLLNKMGARIAGAGTPTIVINGVDRLHGCEHSILPDRIETATYMAAAAVTAGDITIQQTDPSLLDAVIHKFVQAGVKVNILGPSQMRIQGPSRLKAMDVKTLPYPGFPTDMQAQMMVMNAVAQGASVMAETIFENRFMHVSELKRMGADIMVHGNSAFVRGVERLQGAPVMATDLRASASLVLAGLAAAGETHIARVYHIDRGYERIEEKFSNLGADIQRIHG